MSNLRLRIFGLKLLTIIPISVWFAASRDYPWLHALAFFCAWNGVFAAGAAALQRHRVNSVSLTAWDEMAAFAVIAMLARMLQAVGV